MYKNENIKFLKIKMDLPVVVFIPQIRKIINVKWPKGVAGVHMCNSNYLICSEEYK